MKTLFIDCSMGAAGDMLMGALYELLSPSQQEDFLDTMNHLFSEHLFVTASPCEKCGIYGTQMKVSIYGTHEESAHSHTQAPSQEHKHTHSHKHEHAHGSSHVHTSYPEILAHIDSLSVSPWVKEQAKQIYTLIGNAESHVHHTEITQIHFHEVGTLDAIMDIIGCCILIEQLSPEQILASPVHVGSGTVHCAHGILPVPAPATAEILQGIPIYSGTIDGELCTPTGAALLKHFVGQFLPMPPMTVQKNGYGMGTKDFSTANCLRIFLGEMDILPVPSKRQLPHVQSKHSVLAPEKTETHPDFYAEGFHNLDQILELSCNLDDMTPEAVSYAIDILLDAGALDVFTTPVYMKKNRSGLLLTCLCNMEQESIFSRLILTHTTTRGIRIHPCYRRILDASYEKVSTPFGAVTIKISSGYGIHKFKPEYDDVAKAAKEHSVTFQEVWNAAKDAYLKK